jgi:hypothetical protein
MRAWDSEVVDDMSESSIAKKTAATEKHLAPEEVLEKLDSMSVDDKLRLRLIERRRLGGTDFQEGELYKEAVCQAVVGERVCPLDVMFIAFLAQSMRSIASHRRKARARLESMTGVDNAGNTVEMQVASEQLDPEALLVEQESTDTVTAIYECFEGDDEAQLVILAIAGGTKGKALRDEIGVDQVAYDYIMKRVKRVMSKKYPKGWPS